MKLCPNCKRIYQDETLNFCLEDGTPLADIHPGGEEQTRIFNSATAATLWQSAPMAASTGAAATIGPPETRYAKSGDINIAYHGSGLHFEERAHSNFGAGTDGSQLHAVRCDRRSTG